MTIDEAIKHAEEVANGCSKCADEHHQLAEWLKELKHRRENEHSVKALTIDEIAEIMEKVTENSAPCDVFNLDFVNCYKNCKKPQSYNFKDCWKEFFEHFCKE